MSTAPPGRTRYFVIAPSPCSFSNLATTVACSMSLVDETTPLPEWMPRHGISLSTLGSRSFREKAIPNRKPIHSFCAMGTTLLIHLTYLFEIFTDTPSSLRDLFGDITETLFLPLGRAPSAVGDGFCGMEKAGNVVQLSIGSELRWFHVTAPLGNASHVRP